MAARVAKATGTALTVVELFDQFEMCLYHGHQHQLGQAFADSQGEGGLTAVPAGHH